MINQSTERLALVCDSCYWTQYKENNVAFLIFEIDELV